MVKYTILKLLLKALERHGKNDTQSISNISTVHPTWLQCTAGACCVFAHTAGRSLCFMKQLELKLPSPDPACVYGGFNFASDASVASDQRITLRLT